MSTNVTSMLNKFDSTQKKVEEFSDLLDAIETSADKKKLLWKEIYQNAVTDRENASLLFTDAFQHMGGGTAEHATLGTTMSKYLERMCKSNEQILRLAELIAKEEEKSSKINPEDIFTKITGDLSEKP
jgi:hypothetical protein